MLQTLHLFSPFSPYLVPTSNNPTLSTHFLPTPSLSNSTLAISTQPNKKQKTWNISVSYEVGGGYDDIGVKTKQQRREEDEKWDDAQYEAILKGGEQVTSVLEEMITLRKSLLEVIKQTVLSHLTKKCPPHVQVVGLLCRTPQKESRHELLRRVAAGGGVFGNEKGAKVQLPAANLNDIANQADDLLETMESRPIVPDRKLLARLVLIREEARNMMGGGILDERNDRGLNTLPEAEVNFLTKLVALKPGDAVQKMIKNVMQGKDEGADHSSSDEDDVVSGIAGRASVTGRKPLPVRPGMFLETVSKVLGGIYAENGSGITAQHLEWVHQKTLQVLQEIAF
ncbi:hypothetical protein IFM89_023092 [Coptis chinensis]|uniref:Uncharacterized protein n=1 Tax=Coptis chinensis TaxID=261450 RepID=A0A835LWS0_9MAGN|nr:hypothetical protein IFM89_023092 [Coptis chinensis]